MKKSTLLLLVGVLIGLCLMTASLMAETISKTGMSQKALVSFLTNVVTLGNEVKTDHNTLVTTHNTVFNHYTGLRRVLINYTSASTMRTQLSNRTLPTGTSTATTSASDLSLSGH